MARRVRTQLVTILFTDIIGSTEIASELGDRRWKALLEAHHAITRDALRRYRGDEIDTAGDGFFAVFDKQAQAIHCAVEIVERVRDIGLEVRAGLHVGEAELIGGKVGGVAVHTGARVGSIGGPGQVVVSSVLRELVPGSGIEFKDLGTRRLKGLPEPIRLWSVRSIDGKDIPAPLAPDDAAERRAHIPVGPSRRAAFVAGSVAGLAVLGIAGYLAFGRGPSTPTERPAVPIQPKTLIRIEPATMQIETRLELSGDPIDVEFSLGRVWVLEEGILEVLTPGAPEFDRIGLGFEACSLARSERGVIVGNCSDSRLYRVGDDLRVRPLTDTPADGGFILPLETSDGLWVLSASLGEEEDRLYHVDPATGDVLRTVPLPDSSGSTWEFTEAGGFLWTFNNDTGAVLRISPSTGDVTQIESVSQPVAIVSNGEWVWLADWGPDETLQIDPASGDVVDRTGASGVLIPTEDGVWILDVYVLTRVRDDGEITGRIELPYADAGSDLNPGTYGDGAIWIGIRPEDV